MCRLRKRHRVLGGPRPPGGRARRIVTGRRSLSHDGTTIVPFPPASPGRHVRHEGSAEYTRIRRLISAGFTPRMVGRLEEQIRRPHRANTRRRGRTWVSSTSCPRSPTSFRCTSSPTSSASPKPTGPRSSASPTSSCGPPIRFNTSRRSEQRACGGRAVHVRARAERREAGEPDR